MRKPKPPVSAWIVEHRKALGWKSEELARRLDLTESTVRGWEAGRSPSPDNLERLERLFGVLAPGRESDDGGDALAAAIDRQTVVLTRQADALEALVKAIGALQGQARGDALGIVGALGDLAKEVQALPSGRGSGTGVAER